MFKSLRSSVSNRIIWITSTIFIITIFSVGFFTLQFTYREIVTHRLLETSLKAESISKDVKYIFENAKMVTNQLALHTEIKDYLRYADRRERIIDNPYYQETLNTLIQTKKSGPLFFLAWVANEKANFYLDSTGTIPDETYQITARPWYPIAVNADEPSFTPPYVEWGTGRIVISSIKAIRENGETLGYVVMDIVLENVPAIFESTQINLSDKHFLLSSEGDYVYHENPDLVMKAKIIDEGDPLKPYASLIMQGKNSEKTITYEGKKYFMNVYEVDQDGWKVVSLIDESSITQEMQWVAILIIGSMLGMLAVTLMLMYWRINRTMAPYQEVLTFADDIAQGNLIKNIPPHFIEREDEIGSLSRSFQTIINAFRNENQTLEDRISEKNNELEHQYAFILEAEKAASLGHLVAGVAHEINTPVGVSLTTASYLRKVNDECRVRLAEGTMSKEHLKELMAVVDESTRLLGTNLDRAADLVKNFKRLAVDQSSGVQAPFDLRENIEAVIISLLHEYKNLPIKIENRCPMAIELNSYPGAVSQIVTNLLMNSLKHGFPGLDHGEITIEATEQNDQVTLVYTDNGRGISKENLKRIYEPFFTTNRQEGNSGLGMHIVMSLVNQKLKGSIHCESSEGQGVVFTIKIPSTIEA